MSAEWLAAIDPAWVEQRFGDDVRAALEASRRWVEPPAIIGARLVGTVVGVSGVAGAVRLSTPLRVAARIDGDILDVGCACRRGRVCEHVVWLLVDVAFHPALRAAILEGRPRRELDALASELEGVRARSVEERTLEERLRAWLPPRRFEEELELDVEVVMGPATAGAPARPIVLVRHRRAATRALVAARDVLAARLSPRRRRLVDLMVPSHLDRDALAATRGHAAAVVRLLREEIGLFTAGFRTRARFSQSRVTLRAEVVGDRLVARWYAGDAHVADAAAALLLAGEPAWLSVAPTFYEVEPALDLDAALGMQEVPSLPLGDALGERVGRALLGRGRGLGVGLPPPATFGLPALERPTFELRLGGTPLDVRGELFAKYAAGTMLVAAGTQLDDALRDRAAEEAALSRVLAAGLRLADGAPDALVATEDDAVRLWTGGLAELRAAGEPPIVVEVAESLATARVGPPVSVDIRVEASAGWLDTELEFRAGALKPEIAHLHRVIASGRRWVALSDGTLAKITEDVAALVDEAASLAGGAPESARLRLPAHQLGRIERWDALGVPVTLDAAARALEQDARRWRTQGLRAEEARLPASLRATLRPYQATGLAWLQRLEAVGAGGLLADDMGLGKTVMTLAHLARAKEERGSAPSLVVCPTSVVGNWMAEAERFTPDLVVRPWIGPRRRESELADVDLVVTTYGILRREIDVLARQRLRVAILDEAQNIKNAGSDTARAARRLQAETRLALSGTPVENRLGELWSLMTFANPGILGSARHFDERYAEPIALRPDGARAEELRSVVGPFVLRRTKAAVLRELPPKTEIERLCVFGARQKKLYDALSIAVREAVRTHLDRRKGARLRLPVLTAILRLRQMACDPRLVDPTVPACDSAKRAAFLDLVRELVSEDRRALVFSQFVELLALWRQDLDRAKVPYEYLDGATPKRDEVVRRFQEGSAPIFLISLKAGGAGLNLTGADTVIHCDPWWNPAAEDQATDRAHRLGQAKAVTVVRLVAKGTIEDKVELLKEKKREIADAILGAPSALSADDLESLLGESGEAEDDDAS